MGWTKSERRRNGTYLRKERLRAKQGLEKRWSLRHRGRSGRQVKSNVSPWPGHYRETGQFSRAKGGKSITGDGRGAEDRMEEGGKI